MIRIDSRLVCSSAVVLLAMPRLAHVNLLWSDEDYHLAAAIEILHGRIPYRDFWYDKPPLAALFYTAIGGSGGWPLRLLDVLFVLACCWFAYRLAKAWWSEAEGRTAALLLAFFTTFYLPSATIPFAVDGLLLLPHLAAVYYAKTRRPFQCGLCCSIGLLTNVKALFVATTCAVWLGSDLPWFAAGFMTPLSMVGGIGWALGAWPDFYTQVWQWGLMYAKGSDNPNALILGLRRSMDWLAFHCALAAGSIVGLGEKNREQRWKLVVWLLLSSCALLLGNHFAPRYFFQVLPVLVIAASRGIALALSSHRRWAVAVLALLLLVPVVRFGPRYAELMADNWLQRRTGWSDAAMDVDSQSAADFLNARKKAGDTLLVWGYRPDLYVYTRLLAPGKFWDSQPLDGVPADRHLQAHGPSNDAAAKVNRAELIQTRPTFVVDGIGPLNPALSLERFPDLSAWLRDYHVVAQTRLCRIYEKAR